MDLAASGQTIDLPVSPPRGDELCGPNSTWQLRNCRTPKIAAATVVFVAYVAVALRAFLLGDQANGYSRRTLHSAALQLLFSFSSSCSSFWKLRPSHSR